MKRLMGFSLLSLVLLVAAVAAQSEVHLSEFTKILRDWRPESAMEVEPPQFQEMVIYEVTRFPHLDEPTASQLSAAGEFWRRARAAIVQRGWDDFDQALADGFELM